MSRYWAGEVLLAGSTAGRVLRLDAPLSFWGGVQPANSAIVLAGHPQRGQKIADTILVIPQLIGSSSSSAVMLELCYRQLAPRALVLGERDAILPIGVVVAGQMGWPTIPVVIVSEPPFQSGDWLQIDADGRIELAGENAGCD